MRSTSLSTWLVATALAFAIGPAPARALEASDTMASWKTAAAGDKSKLVGELMKADGRDGSTSGVVKCVDAASGITGHADLSIKTVVEACAKQAGEPV